jgi:hypothetical protein
MVEMSHAALHYLPQQPESSLGRGTHFSQSQDLQKNSI